jgi:hypothetical protein
LRDRLVVEFDALQSADEAASWAHRCLPAKDTLSAANAELVEAGFRLKLAAFDDGQPNDGWPFRAHLGHNLVIRTLTVLGSPRPPQKKSAISALSQWARRFASATRPSQIRVQAAVPGVRPRTLRCAHHLRFAQPRALGRKVSDKFTVPVCRLHHRELHRHGDEAAWWNGVNIDPVSIALTLWQSTHRNGAFSPAHEAVQNSNGIPSRIEPVPDKRCGEARRREILTGSTSPARHARAQLVSLRAERALPPGCGTSPH